jgi:hypothetical protein
VVPPSLFPSSVPSDAGTEGFPSADRPRSPRADRSRNRQKDCIAVDVAAGVHPTPMNLPRTARCDRRATVARVAVVTLRPTATVRDQRCNTFASFRFPAPERGAVCQRQIPSTRWLMRWPNCLSMRLEFWQRGNRGQRARPLRVEPALSRLVAGDWAGSPQVGLSACAAQRGRHHTRPLQSGQKAQE